MHHVLCQTYQIYNVVGAIIQDLSNCQKTDFNIIVCNSQLKLPLGFMQSNFNAHFMLWPEISINPNSALVDLKLSKKTLTKKVVDSKAPKKWGARKRN